MTFRTRRLPWVLLSPLALLPLIWPEAARLAAAEEGAAEPAVRYPFDPVCPWGRVADGQGLLVRCLEAAEAARLGAGSAKAPPAAAAEPRPPALSRVEPAPPGASSRRVSLSSVSPARADTGELPEAHGQLGRAGDRYVQCVQGNGGITSSPASVTVRFLVRERGRAEGVTVKERSGLSLAAAKCVAGVVDRRYVGYPAAPIVGADMSFEFVWEGNGR